MNSLTVRAFIGFLQLFVVLGILFFLPAWTWNYWQAWIYLAAFFVPVLLITLFFLRNDPELIARRLKAGPSAEQRTRQKVIQSVASILFVLVMVIPGFDHRLHWSYVPVWVVIVADCFVILGFLVVFFVFKANSYTSGAIELEDGQRVITTGPYAVVRHPMYSGALLMVLFTSPALGSWWALPFAFGMMVVIAFRLLDEEELLRQSLPGYDEYCRTTRYRLVPGLW